jgi:uncharacterized membrane protein YkoI
MKTSQRLLVPTLIGFALLSTGALADSDKKLTEQQVPKAVMEAFHKAYPQATELTFEKEKKAGKAAYEIEFNDQGMSREANYAADGKLLGTEEEVTLDALPASIAEAVKKAHPQATIKEAEKKYKPDGTLHCYEVEINDGKKSLEIHLDESGKILKTKAD